MKLGDGRADSGCYLKCMAIVVEYGADFLGAFSDEGFGWDAGLYVPAFCIKPASDIIYALHANHYHLRKRIQIVRPGILHDRCKV
jgi:hypothetical protein